MAAEITAGRLPYDSVSCAFNEIAAARWPEVAQRLALLEKGSAHAVALSGTGPSVFGLYDDRRAAELDAERIRAQGMHCDVYVFVPSDSAVGNAR
jgi:4-diphosphocytidyl-2C-methyl-D-erythritol kinase